MLWNENNYVGGDCVQVKKTFSFVEGGYFIDSKLDGKYEI